MSNRDTEIEICKDEPCAGCGTPVTVYDKMVGLLPSETRGDREASHTWLVCELHCDVARLTAERDEARRERDAFSYDSLTAERDEAVAKLRHALAAPCGARDPLFAERPCERPVGHAGDHQSEAGLEGWPNARDPLLVGAAWLGSARRARWKAERERDQARAEVERLTRERDETRAWAEHLKRESVVLDAKVQRIVAEAEGQGDRIVRITTERDQARAEVETLRRLLAPLSDDKRTGVALMWGSPLQREIRITLTPKTPR